MKRKTWNFNEKAVGIDLIGWHSSDNWNLCRTKDWYGMSGFSNMVACILAGGQARRMGGGDKCMIPIAGRPMLEHAKNRLTLQVDNIVVNANGDPNRFANLELPVVCDSVKGFAGPLAGIHAGLLWIEQNFPRTRHMLSVAGDTPFFPMNLAAKLAEGNELNTDAIGLASSGGNLHPVFGLWPVSLTYDLQNWLNQNQSRKVLDFVELHPNYTVDFEFEKAYQESFDPFFNVNTPEDIETANTHAQKLSSRESVQ